MAVNRTATLLILLLNNNNRYNNDNCIPWAVVYNQSGCNNLCHCQDVSEFIHYFPDTTKPLGFWRKYKNLRFQSLSPASSFKPQNNLPQVAERYVKSTLLSAILRVPMQLFVFYMYQSVD